MDAAVLGDRVTYCRRSPKSISSAQAARSVQCQHSESSKVLAGIAFCEMLSQYPQSAFHGVLRGSPLVCDPNPLRPFARSRYLLPGKQQTTEFTKFRDGETTIKMKFADRFFKGGGNWGQSGKSPRTLFFMGNATTI